MPTFVPPASPTPSTPQPRRHFVGWDAPLLPTAARWLLDDADARCRDADFSQSLIVVPGARAGRLLLGMLVDEAARRGVAFVPPLLVTPGEMIEALLGVPGTRPASPLARELAWMHVLTSATDAELAPLVGTGGPGGDASRRSLVPALESAHAELGGHGVRFTDVAVHATELGGPSEGSRWTAAARLAERFGGTLESWGFADEVVARLDRVELADRSDQLLRTGGCARAVLVGVPELPGLAKRAIRIALSQGVAIDAIVQAPEALGDRFDLFGCVEPASWTSCALPIDEEQIAFAADQTDQAARALAWIAQRAQSAPADDIVIGIAHESLAALMSLEIRSVSSVRVRAAGGTSADRAEPSRLLTLTSDLLERRTFSALAAFVRHPRVEEWLRAKTIGDRAHLSPSVWLGALDEYGESHAPSRLSSLPAPRHPRQSESLTFVLDAARELLGELWSDQPTEAEPSISAAGAASATLGMLSRLYGHLPATPADPEQARVAQACVLVADDLREHLSLAAQASLAHERPAAFLQRLVSHQASHAIPEPPDSNAIEMVGWLELAHDPSPIAVLVGMNDRNIPGSHDHDPLLPGSLRRRLGLPTSMDRLARDSFLAAAMARSRPHMLFIAPSRDDEGSPLIPSRLLLRCEPSHLAARMRRALGRTGDGPARAVVAPREGVTPHSGFPIAPLPPAAAPKRMSVTSFRDYLASPYLFYLRHVLRLSELVDVAPELDPAAFGSLLHDSLDRFGKSDARDSTDPVRTRQSVLDHFRTLARERFGPRPPVAIAIQIEHADVRLSRWADVQAGRARDGWRIAHTEWRVDPNDIPAAGRPAISVSEGTVELRGKVDRIDVHDPSGRVAVLDYKSSDTAAKPMSSHRTRDGVWRDLQLPLYRDLIRPLGLHGPITLGYFNIPRDLEQIGVIEANWSEAELQTADEAARRVVSCVLRGEFSDLGRMSDEGTLGLIAGLGILSSSGSAQERGPHA